MIKTKIVDNPFIKYSEKEWLEVIKKDLGPQADISKLYPPIKEGIQLNPFAHSSDRYYDPINRNPSQWKITALIDMEDTEDANKLAVFFLQNGANALKIVLREGQSLDALFKDVILKYIFVLLDLRNVVNSDVVKQELKEKFPDFQGHILQNNDQNYTPQLDEEMPVSMLTDILANQIDSQNIKDSTVVEIKVGKHFLIEVAKLRAMRILWANLLGSLNLSQDKTLLIVAAPNENSLLEDPDTALIQLTYMAMSSIIGGADYVLCNTHSMSSKNYQRTALHIQNILALESNIGMVNDPSAGSYVIEDLTNKITEETWNNFIKVAGE